MKFFFLNLLKFFFAKEIVYFIGNIYLKIEFIFFTKKEILNKNIILKNSLKTKKRAFILATGPSLLDCDLKLLKNEDCYSLSNFFLHEDIEYIKPKLHFFAPYHDLIPIENWVRWLHLADTKLPKDTSIVLNHSDKKLITKNNIFSVREKYFIYLSSFASKKNFDVLKPIYGAQTGPLMILPYLFYLGYKEIYLLGCDANNLKNYNFEVENFYDNSLDIRKVATKPWGGGIIKELKANITAFEQFNDYSKLAKKNNIKIFNLSKNSWIESFEKKKFNDVINIKKS
ncbi:hypothetical protein [Candidatus Pelagibacter sp.]|uniref:hypothetical protein n=1 Tax=Candidatus Pelagibacter sp. TaxID=2024849 RepID=UPI003D1241C1